MVSGWCGCCNLCHSFRLVLHVHCNWLSTTLSTDIVASLTRVAAMSPGVSRMWQLHVNVSLLHSASTNCSRLIFCCQFIMVALCNRQTIIFSSCFFFLSSSSFFSSPNLSGRRLDVYHTLAHRVALVEFRMQVWNALHAARCKYKMQKIAISAPSHNFVGPYLHN